MKWENWVKKQLRIYLCRNIDLERIESELKQLEFDIDPSVSKYDPSLTSKTPYRKGSVVEFYAIRREKSRRYFERKKELLEKQIKTVGKAINGLSNFHKEVINKAFLSLDCGNDKNLAECLNVPYWTIRAHKRAALGYLYDAIIADYQKYTKLDRTGEMNT